MPDDYEYRKVSRVGGDSGGITLPKDDLRAAGIIEDGELQPACVKIVYQGDGSWSIEKV